MIKSHKKSVYGSGVFLALLLAAAPSQAQVRALADEVLVHLQAAEKSRELKAAQQLDTLKSDLGLDARTEFKAIKTITDSFGQSHTRFQQHYAGLKVWGGEIITHLDAEEKHAAPTNALEKNISLDTVPALSAEDALAIVAAQMGVKGPYAYQPKLELLIFPIIVKMPTVDSKNGQLDATQVRREVLRHALAYHVHVEVHNADDGAQARDFMIDAHDGAILKQWNSLQTAHVVASGARSQYSGTVSLNTNSASGGYELRDMLRGTGGSYGNNVVLRYVSATPSIGDIFTDASNTWGDGQNYLPGSPTTTDTYQTAAVDVAYGMGATWDFYKKIFNRNGIDGNGKATFAVVHDPQLKSGGVNASWIPACFCMRFGDGDSSGYYKNLTSLDLVGHEMAHGLTDSTAQLVYADESGGLNEATSDILGTAVEFYVRGGGLAAGSASIPASGGNWTIGEGVMQTLTRYMDKPSRDGVSHDAWSLEMGESDVHYSSGPMNRAFYFMSKGATTSGDTSSPHLPGGMSGIGIDRAARIWYRAVATYLTTTSDYVAARQASIAAAKELYGAGSAEEIAVWNAFRAINVGPAWNAQACGRLDAGRELAAGESVKSCNGQYTLIMQGDGNLVLYRSGNVPLWNAQTYGNPGAYSIFQDDGNLVVYRSASRTPLWNSSTYSSPGAQLAVRDDGNMVITSPNGLPVWFVTAPAGIGPVQAASGGNTAFGSADVVQAGAAGVRGAVDAALSQYFRVSVAPGKTLTADFVGGWMPYHVNKFTLTTFNSANVQLGSATSSFHATRLLQSYTNSTGVAQDIVFQVYRNWDSVTPFYGPVPYTIAIKQN
ncbi:M4 family metallopeptidase [Massilia sp. NR 4-1]|uniref:M4 family metallopeptidase n=1 Tax=Massilia sp. NR 4-1 TaxID=1678028 RepID=UPI00067E124A|nr:M4 family metallopeptidase [Massilia sp. NR 4-1]